MPKKKSERCELDQKVWAVINGSSVIKTKITYKNAAQIAKEKTNVCIVTANVAESLRNS